MQHLLNEFELALNPNKTAIIELPDQFDPPWTSKIRVFVFRDAGVTGQHNDLTAYFDMVFDLFKRFPEEGLLKYAIARLRSEDFHRRNWPLLRTSNKSLRLGRTCVYSSGMRPDHLLSNKTLSNNETVVVGLPQPNCLRRVPLGQASEAAWAMWLMKLLNIKLLARSAKPINNSEDSIVGLMALGLAHSSFGGIQSFVWPQSL